MPDKLSPYRKKRDSARTPEPVPAEVPLPSGNDDTFVIQEHHARRLHWDFRLERGGVLVSWAIPRGLPVDPKRNHLAVHTEDHPLEYAAFAGDIPHGEYGGGAVSIWDRGSYETEKWRPNEVIVTLRGDRPESNGRFVLFQTDGDQWMIHRMSPPPRPDWTPLPELVRPMLAKAGELPAPKDEQRWGFEMKWDGVRAIVYLEGGGTVRALTRNDREVSGSYPELRRLAEAMGIRQLVLDGELVAIDENGRPNFGLLQQRMHVTNPSQVRSLSRRVPVTYLVFDVLHLDGRSLLELPYADRRRILDELRLEGPSWGTPPVFEGAASAALQTSEAQGLEGVVAKRLDSPYESGRRTGAWLKVKNFKTQEVVVGGWKPGQGRRAETIGSLLLGVNTERGLVYAGHVGTGFTEAVLDDLTKRLRPLERRTSPFADEVPREHARDAHWVTPKLVGEVRYGEWTRDGRLRHPSWRGLRPDKSPDQVVIEP
jgi:bifunctional non-homologous end joining protein LigD